LIKIFLRIHAVKGVVVGRNPDCSSFFIMSFVILTGEKEMFIIQIPYPPGGGVRERERAVMKHDDAIFRLKNVEGHLRGVSRMVEDGAYCIDIIRQIQAVQAALNKISTSILEQHLNSCLITAVRGDDPDERERVLKEITDVFSAAAKT
jgi:DNA-binding FrmR family transcriptional regulator